MGSSHSSDESKHMCICDDRLHCCDGYHEKTDDSISMRIPKYPFGFRFSRQVKRVDANWTPPPASLNVQSIDAESIQSSSFKLMSNTGPSVDGSRNKRQHSNSQTADRLLASMKPASQATAAHRRSSRLLQYREMDDSSWIEVPKPLTGWSDVEQNFVIEAIKEYPKYHKDPSELEKLIVSSRKRLPLKSQEDFIRCLQHIEASRVAYFSRK